MFMNIPNEDMEEEPETAFEIQEEQYDKPPRQATGPRKTTPYLTKYERARVIGR